ncbi:hypothetical protein CF326_g5283 [Tilletia indica]|nr:hypothetical protein CF326_g5283 [Tilletia indica]
MAYLHHSSPSHNVPGSTHNEFSPMHPHPSTLGHSSQAYGQMFSGPGPLDAPRTLPPFDGQQHFGGSKHLFPSMNSGTIPNSGPPQRPPSGAGAPQGQNNHIMAPKPLASSDSDYLNELASQHREDLRSRLPPEFAAHFAYPLSNGQIPGVPASGSLSPQSLLHLHNQQLQVQQAMALHAAQNGEAGGSTNGPSSGSGGLHLGNNANLDKHAGSLLDYGIQPPGGRFGPPSSAPPPGPGHNLQRPSSSAGRALAGALAGPGLMGLGAPGGSSGLMGASYGGNMGGMGSSTGHGQEEITTVFIVGFPDDMTERELNNMFLFARGFEAATLKVPPTITNPAAAGGPYNVVNLQGPGTSGQDLGFGPGGYPNNDAFSAHFGASNSAIPGGPKNLKNIIGFAKFRTRAEALAARDALNGRKIDAERGCVVKTEMAKKNLHTKQRVPVPGLTSSSGPPSNMGHSSNPPHMGGGMGAYGSGLHHDSGSMNQPQLGPERGNRHSDPNLHGSGGFGFGGPASQFTSPTNVGLSQPGDFDPWSMRDGQGQSQGHGQGPNAYGELRSPMSPHQFGGFSSGQRAHNFAGPFSSSGGDRDHNAGNMQPPFHPGQETGERKRTPPARLDFDFDSLNLLEDSSYQRGYNGGYEHGQLHGTFEGRQLGREKGYEVWDEVGYYEGVAQFWHNALDQTSKDSVGNNRTISRQRHHLSELQKAINAFPQHNRHSEEDGSDPLNRHGSPSGPNGSGNQRLDDPSSKDINGLDITTLLQQIRTKFRLTASLLGIPAKFQNQQPPGLDTSPSSTQGHASGAGYAPGRAHQLSGGQVVDTQQLGF